jgi:hypothetical protein
MTPRIYREQAEQLIAEYRPDAPTPVDVFDFAALAAELGWDVEDTVPLMAEEYVIDEDSARELLLSARSDSLGREIADEEGA